MNVNQQAVSTACLYWWLLGSLFAIAGNPVSAAAFPSSPPQPDQTPTKTSTAEPSAEIHTQAKPSLDRSSPRATMATFLIAIDEAERGQIARFADAIACLDLSGLADVSQEARHAQARKLAGKLNAYLDQHHIELELVPDDTAGGRFTYPDTRIEIAPSKEGIWLFTWDSLQFVKDAPVTPPKPKAPKRQPAPVQTPPPTSTEPAPTVTKKSIPARFLSARATMRTFREAMREGRIADAAECLDLSAYPRVIRSEKGADYAALLQEAIRRTKRVVLQEFSDDPQAGPQIFRDDPLGIIVIGRQADDADRPGYWLFTKETVAGLDTLYENLLTAGEQAKGEQAAEAPFNLSLWLRSHLPDSLKQTWFLMQHWQWVGLAVFLLLGGIARRLTTALLRYVTGAWLRRRGVSVPAQVQLNSLRPVGILAAAAVWWTGLTWLGLPTDVLTILLAAVKFIACWAAVWTAYRAVDLLGDYFSSLAEATETKMDDLLVPFARKVAKTLVTVFGVVFIVEQFMDGKPAELLAGLGLGGLALALAAQDSLKNLFGSLTIIVDRPFKVGDWVLVGDVEGTIETVGFRSTRIRTFYNSVVTVPNSILMNATIDNFGARRYRRTRTMLSLTYSTPPEKMDAFCEGVRELIRLHPHTRKDYYHVYFNQFSASSLDVLLYVFFEVPDWGTELRERHRLFLDILRLADRLGVEFAFPTQSIWMERKRDQTHRPVRTIAPDRDDPRLVGLELAADLFEDTYGAASLPRTPVVIDRHPQSRLGPKGATKNPHQRTE